MLVLVVVHGPGPHQHDVPPDGARERSPAAPRALRRAQHRALFPQRRRLSDPGLSRLDAGHHGVDPFTYAVHGFKALLLKNTGLLAIAPDLAFLLGFTVDRDGRRHPALQANPVTRARPPGHARRAALDPRGDLLRVRHGPAGRDDRERGAAPDRRRARHRHGRAAMGRRCLHPRLRGAAPVRRRPGRPIRLQAGLPGRISPVHRGLARMRRGPGRPGPDRRPRPAGRRRGAPGPEFARAAQPCDGARPRAAGARHRDMDGCERRRHRLRPAPGRRPPARLRLAQYLLCQPPARRDRLRRHPPGRAAQRARPARAPARRPRAVAGHRRADRPDRRRDRIPPARGRAPAGARGFRAGAGRRRRLRRGRAPGGGPHAAPGLLHPAERFGRDRLRHPGQPHLLRGDLCAELLPPAGARLLAAADRIRLPAADAQLCGRQPHQRLDGGPLWFADPHAGGRPDWRGRLQPPPWARGGHPLRPDAPRLHPDPDRHGAGGPGHDDRDPLERRTGPVRHGFGGPQCGAPGRRGDRDRHLWRAGRRIGGADHSRPAGGGADLGGAARGGGPGGADDPAPRETPGPDLASPRRPARPGCGPAGGIAAQARPQTPCRRPVSAERRCSAGRFSLAYLVPARVGPAGSCPGGPVPESAELLTPPCDCLPDDEAYPPGSVFNPGRGAAGAARPPPLAGGHHAHGGRGRRRLSRAAHGVRRHPLGHLGRPADQGAHPRRHRARSMPTAPYVFMIDNSRGLQPKYFTPGVPGPRQVHRRRSARSAG